EDRLAADEELTVVGQLHLEAGKRRADRTEPVAVGAVHRARGRALGEAVALEDQDVEGVEELDDLAREGCAARVGDAKPPAEAFLYLRVHETVGDAMPEGERPRERLPRLTKPADLMPDPQRPVADRPFRAVRLVELRENGGVDL